MKMEGSTYSKKLKCCFSTWRVVRDGEMALELPDGNCPNMSGVIEIAKEIMPEVWRIETYCDQGPDIEYRISNGEWEAFYLEKRTNREQKEFA
jgi:hypothetical protein